MVSLYVTLLLFYLIFSDFSQDNGRTISVLVAAKHNGLDLELVKTQPNSAGTEYSKIHPLGKIPAFEGANGFNLSEVIAIAIYGTLLTSVLFVFSFAIREFPFATHLSIMMSIIVIPVRTTLLITTNSDLSKKKKKSKQKKKNRVPHFGRKVFGHGLFSPLSGSRCPAGLSDCMICFGSSH